MLECNAEINTILTGDVVICPFELDLAIYKKNKYMIGALLQNKNIGKCIFRKSIDCIVCRNNNDMSWCSACNIVGYCSKKCQKEDWPIHKLYCKHIIKKK